MGRAATPATAAALTVGAALGWAPWLRSGERDYGLYELARVARELDVADAAWERGALLAAFSLPVLAGAAWLGWALPRPGVVAALATVGGVVLLAAAWRVAGAGFPLRWGLGAGGVVGSLSLVLAAHTLRGPP